MVISKNFPRFFYEPLNIKKKRRIIFVVKNL